MDSQLRPREIQARIRAGASVEQVADEAGIPLAKVERFAYPVLLERSRAAEMAQGGHPVRDNGPAVPTLAEIVTQAFRARGHNIDDATWDAWRDEDNHWVAQLQWQAGRTTNAAHWRYQPDAHGGTIVALDDTAFDLIDPDFGRPLRGLAPVASDEPEQLELAEFPTEVEVPTIEPEEIIEADVTEELSDEPAPSEEPPHPRSPRTRRTTKTSAANPPSRPGTTSCSVSAAADADRLRGDQAGNTVGVVLFQEDTGREG